jgi:NhaA family Na+:H+ antiporter
MASAQRPLEGTRPVPPEISPRALAIARRILSPIEAFLSIEAASGAVLLAMAAAALALANSAWAKSYHAVLTTPVGLTFGPLHIEEPLRFWINEGLMTIFFFVVGLEIRREIHKGELSTMRSATLPLAAALGGMLVPALIYLGFTAGTPADRRGWGVPIATDIAFALGALTLLGRRVPPALRVLLLAIAIIDDIGSIVVIGLFYSESIRLEGFALAFAAIGAIYAMQRLGVRRAILYGPLGIAVWFGVLRSGVHPAIAGVILGLLTPARAWLGPDGLVDATRATVERVEEELATGVVGQIEAEALACETAHLERVRREALAPTTRLQLMLHPWVAFVIMPIFALANAGVSLPAGGVRMGGLALGIIVGLLVGKPVGIVATSFLLSRSGIVSLPRGIGWRQLLTLGLVAAIGFTMALFVSALAFSGAKLEEAKLAVMIASAIAGCVGIAAGRLLLPRLPTGGAQSALEAETSAGDENALPTG